jgi:GNAT superfamily N-acetyltransferase
MAEIVRATEDHWQQLRIVRLAALEADPSAFGSSLERELPFPEDRWRGWTRTAACFLSVEDGAPTGMASLRVLPEPVSQSATAEINAMWVYPERRGTGAGTGLLLACLDQARTDGHQLVRLWATSGNNGAIKLYEQHGFTVTGRVEALISDPQLNVLEFVLALA